MADETRKKQRELLIWILHWIREGSRDSYDPIKPPGAWMTQTCSLLHLNPDTLLPLEDD